MQGAAGCRRRERGAVVAEVVRAVRDGEARREGYAVPAAVVGEVPGAAVPVGIGEVVPALRPGRRRARVGPEREIPRRGVQVVERVVVEGDELPALEREVQGVPRRDRSDRRPVVAEIVGAVRDRKALGERHAVPAVVAAERPRPAVPVGIGEAAAGVGPDRRAPRVGPERERTRGGVQVIERVVVEGDEFPALEREVQGVPRRDRGDRRPVVAEVVRAVRDREARRERNAAPAVIVGEVPDPAVPVGVSEAAARIGPGGRRTGGGPEREGARGGVQVIDGLIDKGHQLTVLKMPVGVVARRSGEGSAPRLDEVVRAVRDRIRGIERIARKGAAVVGQVPGAPARRIGQRALVVLILGLGPDGGRRRGNRERPVCRGVQVIGRKSRALLEQGVQVSLVVKLPDGRLRLHVPRRNGGDGRVEVGPAE